MKVKLLLQRVSEKQVRSTHWYIISQDLMRKLVTNRESKPKRHRQSPPSPRNPREDPPGSTAGLRCTACPPQHHCPSLFCSRSGRSFLFKPHVETVAWSLEQWWKIRKASWLLQVNHQRNPSVMMIILLCWWIILLLLNLPVFRNSVCVTPK